MRIIRCVTAVIQHVALGVDGISKLKVCELSLRKLMFIWSFALVFSLSSADWRWDRASVGPITVKDRGFRL